MPPKDGSQLAVILPPSIVMDGRNQLREIYEGDQQTQTTSSETMPKFRCNIYYQIFFSLECSWLTKTSRVDVQFGGHKSRHGLFPVSQENPLCPSCSRLRYVVRYDAYAATCIGSASAAFGAGPFGVRPATVNSAPMINGATA